MKVAVFQYDIVWEDKEANKKKITALLDGVDMGGVEWMIFPEMCLTGFSMDTYKAELKEFDMNFFASLSKEYFCYTSFGGVLNKQNKLITLDKKGNVLDDYSKLHLFSYNKEHESYIPGHAEHFFKIDDLKIMPTVCYDLRFSSIYWYNAEDTDVFVVSANWPESRRDHWLTLLKARAIENQSYVIGVNRTGKSPELSYSGDSLIIDPFGNTVLDCESKEGVFVAEISRSHITKVRRDFPFLADRLKKTS
ncbi:MAG: nitrilase-related carbon-nitrogen hydrolase [Pseudomonadota bacterium]